MTYHLLYFFLKLLSYIPFRVMYVISDVLYVLIYYIFRYRRAIVRKNLTESFPEKSSCEIIDIEKKFYRFFADNLLETCKMTTISREEMGRSSPIGKRSTPYSAKESLWLFIWDISATGSGVLLCLCILRKALLRLKYITNCVMRVWTV